MAHEPFQPKGRRDPQGRPRRQRTVIFPGQQNIPREEYLTPGLNDDRSTLDAIGFVPGGHHDDYDD